MSQAAKDVVRRWYEAIVSTGDVSAITEVIAPDYAEVHDGVRYALGIEGAVEHVRGVRRTWPDLVLTVDRQVAEGEWVVSQVTMHGTHLGAWAGLPITGAAMRATAVNVDRVVDGRIVEHGGAANLLGPLLAAGAVRPGESGPAAPNVRQVTPFLHVPDLEAAVTFFRDILGFVVPYRHGDYAYLERDGVALRMLGEPGRAVPGDGETRMTVYIDVHDVDALFRELEPRLRTLPEGHWWPPGDKSWQQRELHVKLPDGHWLAFGQPVRPQ